MRCIYAQCLRILDGTIIVPSIPAGPLRDAFAVLRHAYVANVFGDRAYHENWKLLSLSLSPSSFSPFLPLPTVSLSPSPSFSRLSGAQHSLELVRRPS